MSLQKLEAIAEKIKSNSQLDAKTKADLLELMRSLKTELTNINANNPQTAHAIADSAEASTEQLLNSSGKTESKNTQDNIDGLQKTVEELEVSHPKLVQIVNRICIMLSDIGI